MNLDKLNIFENKTVKIKLLIESFEELNYGRTCWKYKFYNENGLVTNDLLDYENSGLLVNLEGLEFSSKDGYYAFIPKYNPIVYNVKKDSFIEFKAPLKEGNSGFFKNYFNKNKLIIVYRNGIAVIDLSSSVISSIEYSLKEVYIEDVIHINEKEMEIEYRDLIAKEFKNKLIKL